ncbi:MAG TPA: LacI family DNA-binding transcriptional regulator [Hyphomicrobiaceae bacterium]|nr:LacI family DNA-binding transcriptional regulator [Hyphomicrobiaceae bacterium]
MKRIKMIDVARAAGVSAMTVSRALKRDGRISPETRRLILQKVDELGYVPDRLAGSFSSQKSGFVSVLVPSLNNPHFAETASGLQEILNPAGLQLLLGYTGYSAAQAEYLIEMMLERRPEALIVTYDSHTPKARKLLEQSGIPVVEIWEMPQHPIQHVVGFSNRKASAEMTAHLITSGRRNIAYIGECDDSGTRGAERRKGFRDAMRRAGLDPSRQVALAAPPINMMQGREALRTILERWPETDAIMCVSDPAAFGALTECRALGRRVPEDIAVAGFGDFEISRCSIPPISTIVVDALDIGRQTGQLVLRLLSEKTEQSVYLPIAARPEIRQSSG